MSVYWFGKYNFQCRIIILNICMKVYHRERFVFSPMTGGDCGTLGTVHDGPIPRVCFYHPNLRSGHMVPVWYLHGASMVPTWCHYGAYMVSVWYLHGASMVAVCMHCHCTINCNREIQLVVCKCTYLNHFK